MNDSVVINGKYDYIISLGCDCQVAYQLQRLNLRRCSLPFDWTVTTSTKTLKVLKKNFRGWMKFRKLRDLNKPTLDRLGLRKQVLDSKYDINHIHVFYEKNSIKNQYKAIKIIQKKRIKRFLEIINKKNNKILFIITNTTLVDSVELYNFLKKKNGNSKLLVLNHTTEYKLELTYRSFDLGLEVYSIYNNEYDLDLKWKGDNFHWNKLMFQVQCDYIQEKLNEEINNITSYNDVQKFINIKMNNENELYFLNKLCSLSFEGVFYQSGFLKEYDDNQHKIWINDNEATIFVFQSKSKKTCKIKFYNPFFNKGYFNYISFYNFIKNEWVSKEIKENREIVVDLLDGKGIIKIKIDKLYKPYDIFGNDDKRLLSLLITEVICF